MRQIHFGLSLLAPVTASMISSNLLLHICIAFRKRITELKRFLSKNKVRAICSNVDGPKNIMLSEISQRKTNTICYHLYVESKK